LRLAKCCEFYLSLGLHHIVIPHFRTPGHCPEFTYSSSMPFFTYAWDGMLLHSETAASHGTFSQESFDILFRSHLCFYRAMHPNRLSIFQSKPTVLHVFAHGRCANLIFEQLKRCPPQHLRDYVNADCESGYPHEYYESNRTALQIAVDRWFPDIVELLLSHGADVNVSHQAGCGHAMHIVTSAPVRRESEDIKMIRVLLRYGIDVDFSNDKGRTALHTECAYGGVKIVQLLLQNGANPNAKAGNHDTPLHEAVNSSERAFMTREGLSQLEADLTAKERAEIVRALIDHGADLNAQGCAGYTALHKGVLQRNLDICQLLLESGADVNARNHRGETPLRKCVIEKSDDASLRTVDLRSRNLVDADDRREWGKSLLREAAERSRPDTLDLLVRYNADVNACDTRGHTPLRAAVESRDVAATRALLVHGADVSSLYTKLDGDYYSVMDRLKTHDSHTCKKRIIAQLITHVKDLPLAARSSADPALGNIIAKIESEVKEKKERKREYKERRKKEECEDKRGDVDLERKKSVE
jgi:ankyrin repeat protein